MTQHDDAEIAHAIGSAVSDPIGLVLSMNIATRLCVLAALAIGAVVLVLAIMRSAAGGQRSALLAGLGYVGLGLGALGAAYNATVTWQVASMLGETRLAVMIPSIVETVAALLVGVLVIAIARFGNSGAHRP